jgi:hypothetical protein
LQIDPGLKFDLYQFANTRHSFHSCTSESRLAFSDMSRCHVERRKTFRWQHWIPAFVNNQNQFRHVILSRALAWCGPHTRPGAPMPNFSSVKKLVDKKFDERAKTFRGTPGDVQFLMFERFKAAVRQASGYLEFVTAIAYRSWLLGQDSCTVAASLAISPQCVRQQLVRLCKTALRLGYETHVGHSSKGRPRRPASLARRRISLGLPESTKVKRPLKWTPELVGSVEELRKLGWVWAEIGAKIGCSGIAARTSYGRCTTRSILVKSQ